MAEPLATSPPPTQHQNPEPVLPPDPKPLTSAQLPPHTSATTTSDSPTKAAPFEPSPTRPLQVSIPVGSSSGLAAGRDGVKEREPERPTFSQLLAGAMASGNSPRSPQMVALPMVAMPCFVSPTGLLESPRFTVCFSQGQFGMSHQAVLASVTAQAQMQLRTGDLSPSPSPTLPPISSSSTVSQLQKPISSEEKVIEPQAEPLHVSEQKPQSNYSVAKTTSGDGYNWRKYGQKQVKASENSRSYYRCTHANCTAKKKVEHCQDGRVNDITYRGEHSHEPPQKVKCSKERGSHGPLKDDGNSELPGGEVKHLDHCPSKNNQDSGNNTSEQLHCSIDCEVDPNTNTEGDLGEGPDPKRRLCEVPVAYVPSLFKSAREAKVVVQSSCNEGPASDGYRWRKYGQKIVKGSPNPRSYYKCTHTGCPVRKHVERAQDAKTIITTYEGHHNHNIPPIRSSSDPPASMTSNEQMQASNSVDKTLSECNTVNNEEATCDGAAEPQETPLESVKSLSGIGLDSNSKDKSGGNSSDIIQRRLFDENPAVIPVKNS